MIVKNDPWINPRSGQHTFSRHMLDAFSDVVSVACFTDNPNSIGRWIYRDWNEKKIPFLGLSLFDKKRYERRPFIPERLRTLHLVRENLSLIYKGTSGNVFVQSPEVLMAIEGIEWNSICFRYAGANNPVKHSRYRYLRRFAKLYDFRIMKSIRITSPHVMLVASDRETTLQMSDKVKDYSPQTNVCWFPTRVNTSLFKPYSKRESRIELGLNMKAQIFVSCGRISGVKGWKLILDSFAEVLKSEINAFLVFVGDGEDRKMLESKIQLLGLSEKIRITGFISQMEVAKYLSASNAAVVGSIAEGWSLAMMEMLACGCNIASTDVQCARALILDGKTGYICEKRTVLEMAKCMVKTTGLSSPNQESISSIKKYASTTLRESLLSVWNI